MALFFSTAKLRTLMEVMFSFFLLMAVLFHFTHNHEIISKKRAKIQIFQIRLCGRM